MPSKNSRKIDASEQFYHVYNRGVNKRRIFLDDQDYAVFLNLLKRYLSFSESKDSSGRPYTNYSGDIELLAFCLMPNHFHMLVYQQEVGAMTKLLQAVGTAYTRYFNKKYSRVGHLFQDRFKASIIQSDSYILHISRYIHLNPKQWQEWEYSSLEYFIGNKSADWVRPERILEMFEGESYSEFLKDYEEYKESLEEITPELADN